MMPEEPEEIIANQTEPEVAGKEDRAVDPELALAEEKQKAEGYLANWQRTQADFINYKRRTEQERAEFSKFANASLILGLLPVLDDLERALDSSSPKARTDWVAGIKLIEHNFRSFLEAQGLTPIKAIGEPFDPRFHEALRQDKGQDGIVIEEFQKGYLLHDRVLRPAKVVVGNGEETEKEDN